MNHAKAPCSILMYKYKNDEKEYKFDYFAFKQNMIANIFQKIAALSAPEPELTFKYVLSILNQWIKPRVQQCSTKILKELSVVYARAKSK